MRKVPFEQFDVGYEKKGDIKKVQVVNDNNNNNEILIKREPLVYTRAWRAVQKKEKEKRLGQYNSNNNCDRYLKF